MVLQNVEKAQIKVRMKKDNVVGKFHRTVLLMCIYTGYKYIITDMGKLLGLMGRIVKRCVREVSLAQVSCILMYVYVALPTPVGAWSVALGLRQRFEYYYY